jgi:hypothetical protein
LLPWLGEAMASQFVRGGVTGVGIVTVIAGLRDLTGALLSRRSVTSGERSGG